MQGIEILRKNNDPLLSIDFGEIYFNQDQSVTKILLFVNKSDDDAIVRIIVPETSEKFPVRVKFIELGDSPQYDDTLKYMFIDTLQEDIECPSNSTRYVLVILTSTVFANSDREISKNSPWAGTSYFNISAVINFQTVYYSNFMTGQKRSFTTSLPLSASLCTSILYVDQTEIEFEACILGNTYVRDLQIWNRSECRLLYRITPTDHSLTTENCPLRYTEFDSSRQLQFQKILEIAPYASKRIRCTFKAKNVGKKNIEFLVENINNSSNSTNINCTMVVLEKEENNTLSIETESGDTLGSGYVLDLGDCYSGLVVFKRLWARNNTTDFIHLSIDSDHPTEVTFDFSGHLEDKLITGLSSSATNNTNLTTNLNDDINTLTNNSTFDQNQIIDFEDDEDDDDEDNTNNFQRITDSKSQFSKYNSSHSSYFYPNNKSSLHESQTNNNSIDVDAWSTSRASGTCLQIGYSLWDKMNNQHNEENENEDYDEINNENNNNNNFNQNNSTAMNNTKNHYKKPNKYDASHNLPFSSFSTNYQKHQQQHVIGNNDYEIEPTVISSYKKYSSLKNMDAIDNAHPFTSKSTAMKTTTAAHSSYAEEVILKPGASIPFTLQYCASVNTDLKPSTQLFWTTSDFPYTSNISPTYTPTPDLDTLGSLVTRNIKLEVSWKCRNSSQRERTATQELEEIFQSSFDMNSDSRGNSAMNSKFYKTLTCRARCCTSIISVTPKINDLGECNIGEYRSAIFTVKNESDLPALVFPHVESETLGITEKEVIIPPRLTKEIKFEYVARVVNTEYKREAIFMNGYNSYGNISVQIRAKNVDVQQILLHSQFYKVYTRNHKRQLQLYYDNCIFNTPNIRTFSIRNIFNNSLLLELLPVSKDNEINIIQIFTDEIQNINKIVSSGRSTSTSHSSQHISQAIEDLKWGNNSDKNTHNLFASTVTISNLNSFCQDTDRRKYSLGEQPENLPLAPPIVMPNIMHRGFLSSISSSHLSLHFGRNALDSSDGTTNTLGETRWDNNSSQATSRNENQFDFLKYMDSPNFPFGLLNDIEDMLSSNYAYNSNEHKDEELPVVSGIRHLQKCYREFEDFKTNPQFTLPIAKNYLPNTVLIPAGRTVFFAVEFTPQSSDKPEELGQILLSKEIQIRLLALDDEKRNKLQLISAQQNENNANNVNTNKSSLNNIIKSPKSKIPFKDTPSSTSTSVDPIENSTLWKSMEVNGEPLKVRTLLIRAKASRSEMNIMQKNLNFGKTTVGELTTMGVTVLNKSKVPLLYHISKSGSISSGFLKIPSGRKGKIDPLKSQLVEFAFKPTLAGPFEETLQIVNILDPKNTISIVIKARVFKPEFFYLLPHKRVENTKLKALLENDENVDEGNTEVTGGDVKGNTTQENSFFGKISPTQDIDLKKTAMDLITSIKSVVDTQSIPVEYLGEMAVGEPSSVILSFRVRNTTNKMRNFIIDSSHSEATCLMSTSMVGYETETETPFEPIPETLQSICTVRCQFEEYSIEAMELAGRMSLEERQSLEDKLEQYEQKLKIAIRKKKPIKILKYESKVSEAKALLAGVVTTGHEGIFTSSTPPRGTTAHKHGEAESPKVATTVNASTAVENTNQSSVKRYKVHGDTPVFHFQLGAEKESVIQVKVTLFPGQSYEHWDGPLPFRGSLRVLEARNEDAVKFVHYCAIVYSSIKDFGASAFSTEATTDPLLEIESLEGFSNASSAGFEPLHKHSNRHSAPPILTGIVASPLRQESALSTTTSISDAVEVNSNEKEDTVEVDSCVFLTTIAQWSTFLTKEIIPWYKVQPQNILGMGVKLVQASKDRAMHASLTVASLASEEGILEIWLVEEMKPPVLVSIDHHTPFRVQDHGSITFSIDTKSERQYQPQFLPRIKAPLGKDGTAECIVQWQPGKILPEQLLIGYIGVRVSLEFGVGTTQYIPLVCYWEDSSIIKVDRSVNFGEVPLGTSRNGTLTLANVSETETLVYNVRLLPVSQNNRGNIDISLGRTGFVEPRGKKTIGLTFSGTSLGKFEQELLVNNINDGFDQRRISITATITWPQSQFIQLPDFDLDAKGKPNKLDLGLIQIPIQDNKYLSNPKPSKLYHLRIKNVSGKKLYVTAVSNLKKQCFIYSELECVHAAVTYPMPIRSMTTLYVAIRPSMVSQDQSSSEYYHPLGTTTKQTSRQNRELEEILGKGRELAGGIRLVFFSSSQDDHHEFDVNNNNNSSDLEPLNAVAHSTTHTITVATSNLPRPITSPTPPSPSNTPRKLFETSIMFRALVGRSILRGRVITPILRCCRISGEAINSTLKVRGVFSLHNASQVFPLRYSYHGYNSSNNKDNNNSSNNISTEDNYWFTLQTENEFGYSAKLRILDRYQNSLAPGKNKLVQYEVEIVGVKGLLLFNLKLNNEDTFETLNLSLSIFVDQSVVSSTLPKLLLPIKQELNDSVTGRIITGNGIRYLQDAFVTAIENSVCKSPFWIETDPSDDASECSGNGAPTGGHRVIGSSVVKLCEWKLSNVRNVPITLTPVSDLPVTVLINDTLSETVPITSPAIAALSSRFKVVPSWMAAAAGDLTDVTKKVINRSEGRNRSNQYTSLLSIPDGIWRRGLERCGDAFTIAPGQTVTICVIAKIGATLSPLFFSKSALSALDTGKVESGHGVIAFVTAAQALHSFFVPSDPSPIHSSPSCSSTEGICCPELLPIACYTRIFCGYVIPKFSVSKSSFQLGSIRLKKKQDFCIQVQNCCEIDLPIYVDGLKPWLQILGAKPYSVSSGTSEDNKKLDNKIRLSKGQPPLILSDNEWWKDNDTVKKEFEMRLTTCAAREYKRLQRSSPTFSKDDDRNQTTESIDRTSMTLSTTTIRSVKDIPLLPSNYYRPNEIIYNYNTHSSAEYEDAYTMPPEKGDNTKTYPGTSVLMIVPSKQSILVEVRILVTGNLPDFLDTASSLCLRTLEQDLVIKYICMPPALQTYNYQYNSKLLQKNVGVSVHIHLSVDPSEALDVRDATGTPLIPKSLAGGSSGSSANVFANIGITNQILRSRLLVNIASDLLLPKKSISIATSGSAGSTGCISTGCGNGSSNCVNTQLSLRNQLPDCVRIEAMIIPKEDFKDYLDFELYLQGGMAPLRYFDLVPGELTEVRLCSRPKVVAFSSQSFNWLTNSESALNPSDAINEAQITDGGSTSSITTTSLLTKEVIPFELSETGTTLGPCSFGSLRFKSTVVQLSSSGTWPSSAELQNTTNDNVTDDDNDDDDSVTIDMIGKVKLCPIADTCPQSLSFNVVRVSLPNAESKVSAAAAVGLRGPRLTLSEKLIIMELKNPLSESCSFSIQGYSLRRAGMRLQLERQQKSETSSNSNILTTTTTRDYEDVYDTVMPVATPSECTIAGGESQQILIRLVPGLSNTAQLADSDLDLDGTQTISGMRLAIWATEFKAHPPKIIQVSLRLDEALPPLLTQPVSDIATSFPRKIEVKQDMKIPNINANDNKANPSNAIPPKIRLRCATPCVSYPGQFEICLGQQVQRKESLEWMITLENTSDQLELQYRIHALSAMDESWIALSQHCGDVPPASSSSLMLYFGRKQVGIFFTYIVIENATTSGDLLVLRVSMEVVQNCKRNRNKVTNADGLQQQSLFQVKTALTKRQIIQKIPSHLNTSNITNNLLINFGNVYFGKIYRRRSFVIANTSDISLEFKITSTFPATELIFTLSPISLKSCAQLTIDSHEKRQIFVVYRPSFPIVEKHTNKKNNDSNLTTSKKVNNNETLTNSNSNTSLYSFEKDYWRIEGEIFLTCRLVKDHYESIRVIGRGRYARIKISLENTLPFEGSVMDGLLFPSLATPPGLLQLGSELGVHAENISRWVNCRYIQISSLPTTTANSSSNSSSMDEEDLEVVVYSNMKSFQVSVIRSSIMTSSTMNIGSSNTPTARIPHVLSTTKSTSFSDSEVDINRQRIVSTTISSPFQKSKKEHSLINENINAFSDESNNDNNNNYNSNILSIKIPAKESIWLCVSYVPKTNQGNNNMNNSDVSNNDTSLSSVSEELFAEASGSLTENTNHHHPHLESIEDHFTIYNKHLLSEKYRIPIRMIPNEKNPKNSTPPSQDFTLHNSSLSDNFITDIVGVGLGSTTLLSFSELEGAIAVYLRNFTLFWTNLKYITLQKDLQILDSIISNNNNNDNDNNRLRKHSNSYLSDDYSTTFFSMDDIDDLSLSQPSSPPPLATLSPPLSSSFLSSTSETEYFIQNQLNLNMDSLQTTGTTTNKYGIQKQLQDPLTPEQQLQILIENGPSTALAMTMTNIFQRLDPYLDIKGGAVLSAYHRTSPLTIPNNNNRSIPRNSSFSYNDDNNKNQMLGRTSKQFEDLLFHFFALTDELTLLTLRQSSLGNALMSSVHTGQPAARLAQLLFTVVFGHIVFKSYCDSNGKIPLPKPLTLFAKQLFYYMGFFPEVGGSMEPLLEICDRLRAVMTTTSTENY